MTSKVDEAYVWIWLPEQTEPVVAGRLSLENDQLLFNYGQSYLRREDAIAIYEPELPLKAGRIEHRRRAPQGQYHQHRHWVKMCY
jgi:serine/threonine-protein kinase HipA